ncbi:unnamed protein product [Rotaria sordida]|uniref:Uncharacterized protein n=1 Tax=Rotaria sordida TaxID=392033 RepID=A0A814YY71_9BILA|nr:unnamed protein product [Rotaria sordida]
MVPSSGVIYSINVSDPTILATTTTTSFLNESSSISTNIGNFSATPGSTSEGPPILAIILPAVLVPVVGILLFIAGYFYCRRRKRNKKPGNYTLEQVSPSKQYDSIYDDNTNTLDTDRGYSVWRPVKQNI